MHSGRSTPGRQELIGQIGVAVVCTAMLGWAIYGNPPYAFFGVMKWAVSAGLAWSAWLLYRRSVALAPIILILMALAGVHAFGKMEREEWMVFNYAAVGGLLVGSLLAAQIDWTFLLTKNSKVVLFSILIVGLLVGVYPTPFEPGWMGDASLRRVNRLTGTVQVWSGYAWETERPSVVEARQGATAEPDVEPKSEAEILALGANQPEPKKHAIQPNPTGPSDSHSVRKAVKAEASAQKMVVGKLGQALKQVSIRSKPSTRARTYYRVKPYEYLVINAFNDKFHKVLPQNGTQGYVETAAVVRLAYDVTMDKPSAVGQRAAKQAANKGVWSGTAASFVQAVFGEVGVRLPANLDAQLTVGKKIAKLEDLRAGDRLYFWNKQTDRVGYAGIYLGKGYIIQTFSPPGRVTSVHLGEKQYRDILIGARRDEFQFR